LPAWRIGIIWNHHPMWKRRVRESIGNYKSVFRLLIKDVVNWC
jgi:hypothetical protein